MTGLFRLLVALAATQVQTQTQTPPAPRVAEEIVVTAERGEEPRGETPAAVSVLTREEIERLPADTLPELIGALPGFHSLFAAGFGGVPIVSSRGFFGGGEAEYVLLLVDGVPVSDVESGLADWRRIRAADVERIEALRGPASSLYGETALGGVIQVFTRGSEAAPGGAVSLSGGSFESAAVDLSLRGRVGPLRIGGAAGASRTGGFREHSATEDGGVDLALGGAFGPGLWTLALSGSTRDREEPGPLTREELARDRSGSNDFFRDDREETNRGRVSFSYAQDSGPWKARGLLYGTLRDSEFLRTLLVAAGVPDRTFRSIEGDAIGGSLDGERRFAIHGRTGEIRGGTDFAFENLDALYRAVSGQGDVGEPIARASGERERFAVFLSGGWHVTSRLRVTAGTRYDRLVDDFSPVADRATHSAWSPRAGINLRLGEEASPVALFVQASRAFKAPTLDQLFDPRPFSDFSGGFFTISNPDLSPQRATTVELGVSRRDKETSWEVVAYRTEVDDEIDFDAATFRYRNIGRSLHLGVEAAARLFQRRAVSPSVSYAWTRVEPREGEIRGKQLKNIPEHLLRPAISVELPLLLRGEVRGNWIGEWFLDDDNQFPMDDAFVLDLRLERDFGPVRARLDLLNLTDEEYTELGFVLPDFVGGVVAYEFPSPGFAARAGLDWKF
ncbi:MAG: TonB-dependent receptor [Thermoanaerobaculia bacterium]